MRGTVDANRLALGGGAGGITRTYGDDPLANAQLGLVRGSLVGADTLSSIVAGSSLTVTGIDQRTPVGTSSATVSLANPGSLSLATANGGYFIDTRTATTVVTTTPKVLQAGAFSGNQDIYGQPTTLAYLQGVLTGDDVGLTANVNSGQVPTALRYDPNSETFTFPVNQPVGGHYAFITGLNGTAAGNYTLGSGIGALGSVYIRSAPLTITANTATKIYGQSKLFTGTEYGVTGLVQGDSVASATLTSPGAVATANVGGYTMTASNVQGIGLSNYDITYVDGTLNVTPAPLTITANDATKTYGQIIPLGGGNFAASGLVNSDSISSAALNSSGSASTANAGNHAISISNAQGSGLSNYAITYVPGVMTVNQAPLSITANSANKTYGSAHAFAGTEFASSGMLNGDTIGQVSIASSGSAATANGGVHGIVASNAQGVGIGNYAISYLPGILTVTPKTITATAGGGAFVYGNAVTPAASMLNGLMPWDVGLLTAVTSARDANGNPVSLFAGSRVGTYNTHVTGLTAPTSPGVLANYVLAASGHTAGQITITPRTLTYVLSNSSAIYGSDAIVADGTSPLNGRIAGFAFDHSAALQVSAINQAGQGAAIR
ncbi:MAG: MBG domain-containing protein, partial [Vicinamibacterales bacterium]